MWELNSCFQINGTPRATFETEHEAEIYALANEHYVGDFPWPCDRCGKFHLYRPEWLFDNRVAQIRRGGDEILSPPVGDQESCLDWLRRNLQSGDELLHIASREFLL